MDITSPTIEEEPVVAALLAPLIIYWKFTLIVGITLSSLFIMLTLNRSTPDTYSVQKVYSITPSDQANDVAALFKANQEGVSVRKLSDSSLIQIESTAAEPTQAEDAIIAFLAKMQPAIAALPSSEQPGLVELVSTTSYQSGASNISVFNIVASIVAGLGGAALAAHIASIGAVGIRDLKVLIHNNHRR